MRWAALAFLALAACAGARAHEVRPVYLSAIEAADGAFDVIWKRPAAAGGVLNATPVFPEKCAPDGATRLDDIPGALAARWRLRCAEGMRGAVRIDGLERTLTSAYVRVEWRNGRVAEGLLTGAAPRLDLDAPAAPAAAAYFGLGVQHISLGLDHLAFVACLVMIVAGWRMLLTTLTAFTLAHSITLSAAALGLAGAPQRPVEAVIAFSIAVVAREAHLAGAGAGGSASRAPWIVAFGFGLLHGFGFAGALSEIGLPQDAKLWALVLFNLGVEAGQILVVLILAPMLALATRFAPARRTMMQRSLSLALGGLAMFWLLERVAL
jgi:hypothetical protein